MEVSVVGLIIQTTTKIQFKALIRATSTIITVTVKIKTVAR